MTKGPGHDGAGDPASTIAFLEGKLLARDRTIAALMDRAAENDSRATSAMGATRRYMELERVVTRKTHELEDERRQLQETVADLKNAQARLLQAQKMESIGQLAAGIAHEINTPTQYVSDNVAFVKSATESLLSVLDVALGLVDAVRDHAPADRLRQLQDTTESVDLDFLREQLPDAFTQCADGLRRIATIVAAMKAFSHPSRGSKSEENIAELVHTTLVVARNELKYVADVEEEHDPDVPRVACLRDEISQVVLNLAVNAAHAISESLGPGRERGRIHVATRATDEYVEIAVADDGTGIPESIRDRIFDPFFTTKSVGRGTGQGLAMAYNVVEKHKGRIFFETEPGRGTTFYVRLPRHGFDPGAGLSDDDAGVLAGRGAEERR